MKILFFTLLMIMNIFGYAQAAPDTANKVVVFNITGEIDQSSLAMVRKAYSVADKERAALIVMQMDTFGGAVDAATKIRDIVIDSKIDTVCLVKNRAWSAGALIAMSHKRIAMSDSSSIGAAEPIPTTEKTVSALKAEFAATAARTGRNEKIAEAMVDKTLGYKNYAQKGQILSLTAQQALTENISDFAAQDVDEVIRLSQIEQPQKVYVEKTFTETFLGWLASPFIKTLLITVIMLGIITEIKSAGTGVAGIVAVIAGIGVFGADFIGQSGGLMTVLIFLVGVGLLVLEVFVPGFGIAGILGTIMVIASFFLTLGGGAEAVKWLGLSIVLAAVGVYILSKYLPNSPIYNKIVLKNTSSMNKNDVKIEAAYSTLVGKQGRAVTLLRPAGKINIEGQVLDAMTYGDFLAVDTAVVVDKVQGEKIYVNKVN